MEVERAEEIAPFGGETDTLTMPKTSIVLEYTGGWKLRTVLLTLCCG